MMKGSDLWKLFGSDGEKPTTPWLQIHRLHLTKNQSHPGRPARIRVGQSQCPIHMLRKKSNNHHHSLLHIIERERERERERESICVCMYMRLQ
ncbi:hypothetical protein MIMGU_mgv1a017124mg [Erythranthe guttata]|uniref:Uncharacterized protein n=1 Tax=Erythranthe guttata TaxID=4155 RepID=A0A022QDJ5_ERYGU|nr:hypothetical protein MIMGU_mgv1a017124mg [Erythranthe guttata]